MKYIKWLFLKFELKKKKKKIAGIRPKSNGHPEFQISSPSISREIVTNTLIMVFVFHIYP